MPASVSLVASAESTGDLSVYSFAGTALGAAAANRKLIVAVTARNAGTTAQLTGVKIGGVACTSIVNVRRNTSGTSIVAMFAVEAGSGFTLDGDTSDTVELTFNETMLRAGIDVFRLVGASSLYPWQTASALTGTQAGTASIDIPESGCAIGAFVTTLSTAGAGASWTNLTERSDRQVESAIVSSTACDDFAGEQVSRSITADSGNGAAALSILALASWTSRVSVFFKANGTFTVPIGVTAVRFDAIGSGGNAGRSASTSNTKPAGGGGASQGATFPATAGESWNIVVPAGGATSAATVAAASGTTRTLSTDYGRSGVYGGSATTAVVGGKAANNTRAGHTTLHYSNDGGDGGTASSSGQGGGGAAGGPHGGGKNGGNATGATGSAGGGGTNGGSSTAGANVTSSAGGQGGTSRRAAAGPAGGANGSSGTAGADGSGGSGSGNNSNGRGGAGSMDWVFTQTSDGEKAGPGSGAGGAQRNVSAGAGGAGGLYGGGGGGGGGGGTGTNVGPGAPGIVVASWEPPASSGNRFILGSPRSTFYKGAMGSSRYVGASYGGEWTP